MRPDSQCKSNGGGRKIVVDIVDHNQRLDLSIQRAKVQDYIVHSWTIAKIDNSCHDPVGVEFDPDCDREIAGEVVAGRHVQEAVAEQDGRVGPVEAVAHKRVAPAAVEIGTTDRVAQVVHRPIVY